MNKLKDLVNEKLFNPKNLPKINNDITLKNYSLQNYKNIIQKIDDSYKENKIINNHFIDYIIFIHPDTNKSFLLFTIHYYQKKRNIYIHEFLDYDDIECKKFIDNDENYIVYFTNKILNNKSIKLNNNEFNSILKILCNKLMICGDKLWTNYHYNSKECPFCVYNNKY